MIDCKNCIHIDVCENFLNEYKQSIKAKAGTKDENGNLGIVAKKCPYERNKEKLLELPCAVGDFVEWNNGICKSLHQVKGLSYSIACGSVEMRFLLDDFSPIVNHNAIVRIVPKDEAKEMLCEADKIIFSKG